LQELLPQYLPEKLYRTIHFPVSIHLLKNNTMKTTLCKVIYLSIMLTLGFNNADAKKPRKKVSILSQPFKKMNGILTHDTLGGQNNTNKNWTGADIKLQASLKKFVADYLKENGEMLEDIKLKNNAAFKTIEKIFENRGIPVELKYLAVVESKLKNTATSGRGAAGIWQLMPVTAGTLGLRVNGKMDERRSTYQSTVAAAKYLKILYSQFDDWLLVIAAYNCGAGNVFKAIKKSGSHEFWKMQNFLPSETRKHVKKFIATHFYYEEKGSLVTLTKTERKKYLAAINETGNKQSESKPNELPVPQNNFVNWVCISHDENKFIFVPRK
jgi:membrane-bound lytic murein transglycosylase D